MCANQAVVSDAIVRYLQAAGITTETGSLATSICTPHPYQHGALRGRLPRVSRLSRNRHRPATSIGTALRRPACGLPSVLDLLAIYVTLSIGRPCDAGRAHAHARAIHAGPRGLEKQNPNARPRVGTKHGTLLKTFPNFLKFPATMNHGSGRWEVAGVGGGERGVGESDFGKIRGGG